MKVTSTKAASMKSKMRELTADEWFHVRTLRGKKMTGQSAHRTHHVPINKKNPTIVRGTGKTYYWCMGLQPNEDVIKTIARRCPIKAAEAFLAHYGRNEAKGPYLNQFIKPRKLT